MDDMLYHIKVRKTEDLPRYMITCGAPERAKWIADDFLEEAVELAHNREYWSFVGKYKGVRLAVSSMGIGSPSNAIGLEEFGMCGVDTFVRVGTAGSLQPHVSIGTLVNATGAVRDEGTSPQYIPLEYPAVATVDVVLALREAAKRLGVPQKEGLIHSKDSFYSEEPGYSAIPELLKQRWDAWMRGNVLATEMESSLLFVLAQMRGWRAGTVVAVIGSTHDHSPISDNPKVGQKEAIRVALEGVVRLAETDKGS